MVMKLLEQLGFLKRQMFHIHDRVSNFSALPQWGCLVPMVWEFGEQVIWKVRKSMAKRFISKEAADVQGITVTVKSGKCDPQRAGTKTPSGKQNRHNPRLNCGGSRHVAEAISRWSAWNSPRDRNIVNFCIALNIICFLKDIFIFVFHYSFFFSVFIHTKGPGGLSLPAFFSSRTSLLLPSVRAKPGLLLFK